MSPLQSVLVDWWGWGTIKKINHAIHKSEQNSNKTVTWKKRITEKLKQDPSFLSRSTGLEYAATFATKRPTRVHGPLVLTLTHQLFSSLPSFQTPVVLRLQRFRTECPKREGEAYLGDGQGARSICNDPKLPWTRNQHNPAVRRRLTSRAVKWLAFSSLQSVSNWG